MVIALALMSAALFGTGVALQQRPASEVPAEFAARPGLLVRRGPPAGLAARGGRRRSPVSSSR